MSALSHFTTRRPVAVLMVVLATGVFGYFSYRKLPLTLMPELTYPTLTVRTEYPGAAPEEVENDVSRPLEEALGIVGGLRRIASVSRAGVSDVVLEFSWDSEVDDATQDVLERLDLVFLPEGAERPLILHFDPSLDPVLELSLSGAGERFAGEEGLRRLRRLADREVKRALEPIKGVAAARVRGGLEEEIHVLLSRSALERTGLSIQQVIERLRQENINVAGGTLKEGTTEYMVRTLNEYADLGQIRATVVARRDGRDVRLGDLGRVEWSHKEREILTRTDGDESVQIDLYKEAEANLVDLAGRVREAIGTFDFAAAEAGTAAVEERAGGFRFGRGGSGGGGDGPAKSSGLAEDLFRAEGAKLAVVADRSVFIERAIQEVRSTALLGGLLAVVVLFLFLKSGRSTAIIAASIPISLLVTFAPMNLLGVSLNIMSLGGLALGVGMLVDNSIVVLESIFRCREEGDGLVAAAVRGTEEVRGAVVASTLTTVAVFLPMVFVEGVAGEAFGDLGLAVVVSLLASLAVAVLFIPMLASRGGFGARGVEAPPRPSAWTTWPGVAADLRDLAGRLRAGGVVHRTLWALAAGPLAVYLAVRLVLGTILVVLGKILIFVLRILVALFRGLRRHGGDRFLGALVRVPLAAADRLLAGLHAGYPRLLRRALARPQAVLVLLAVVVAATWMAGRKLESELLPEVHQGEFTFEVALPVGTPLAETEAVLAPVEAAILAEKEYIRSLILTVGFDAANSRRADEGEHSARFKVLLEPPRPTWAERFAALAGGEREATDLAAREEVVIDRLRRRLGEVPGGESRVVRPVLFSTRTPVEVEVHGDDLPRLKAMAARATDELARLPELTDVETTQKSGAPEVQIVYDRDRLAIYGLDLRATAELVRNQVQGFEATRFNLKDRRVPIVARLEESDRETKEDVATLVVNPGGERPIPLAAVATVDEGLGPSEVRRVDGRRIALIQANVGASTLGGAAQAAAARLAEAIDWPADMTFVVSGQNEEWEQSRGSLMLALALSIFLVYVIMAAQFESFLQPLVIMFTIPLAFVGSLVTLWLLGMSLSVVVFLGMILLAGVVVNNAIVLVDYANTLERRGLTRAEALVQAGAVRLRPILMTTGTTVLGLLPMALGLGEGAEIRTPMAVTVIAGLTSSTLLTLVVIPVVDLLVHRLRRRLTGQPEAATVEPRESAAGVLAGAAGAAS